MVVTVEVGIVGILSIVRATGGFQAAYTNGKVALGFSSVFVADVFTALAALYNTGPFTGVFEKKSRAFGALLMDAHDCVPFEEFKTWYRLKNNLAEKLVIKSIAFGSIGICFHAPGMS